ncbi:MAG: sulfatase [Acidobacteriota bacterium]
MSPSTPRTPPQAPYTVPLTLLAAVTALVIGCSPGPSPVDGGGTYLRVAERLLDPPQAPLRLRQVTERSIAVRNRLDSDAKPHGWTVIGSPRRDGEGLHVDASGGGASLTLERSGLATLGEMTSVAVRVRTTGPGAVRVLWAEAGQDFDELRSVRRPVPASKGKWREVELDLRSHPQWSGRIDRVRVIAKSFSGSASLRRVELQRNDLNPELLAPKLLQPWSVELDDEQRAAIPSLPGLSYSRRVGPLPEAARLRLSYGLLHGGPEVVPFEIAVRHDGQEAVVLQEQLSRTQGTPPQWQRAEVDLSAYVGAEVEIELRNPLDAEIEGIPGIALWGEPEIVAPVAGPPPANVVLISYDTMRADRSSLYGNPRPTTPNLDRWAGQRGVVFDNVVAAAPWTLPSHSSMLTGLEAFRHGVNLDHAAPDALQLLPEVLRDQGYRTLAVTGGGYLSPDYGLAQGFDRFRYWPGTPVAVKPGDLRNQDVAAHELDSGMGHALDWIDEHADEPFFLFFHTYELHNRSRARQPWFDQWSEHAGTDARIQIVKPEDRLEEGFERRRELRIKGKDGPRPVPPELAQLPYDLYDSGLAYADVYLGRLLDRLVDLGLDERTLVVFTSDHGEMLGEHGLAGHLYLFEDNVLVPLVISGPGVPSGARIERQVRSIDIVPTVLDLLGLRPPAGLDGQSLKPLLEDSSAPFPGEAWTYVATSNYGASLRLRNRFKYTFRDAIFEPIHGQEAFYDLEQLPLESTGLEPPPPQADEWRRHLRQVLTDEMSGIHVRFVAGDAPLTARLAGASIRKSALKSVDMGGPWVRWSDKASIEVEVPPGEDFVLKILSLGGGRSPFWIEEGGGRPFSLDPERVVDLVEEPLWVDWNGGSWAPVDGPPTAEEGFVGMEIRRLGIADQGGALAPEDTNDELRRQLEALGYL